MLCSSGLATAVQSQRGDSRSRQMNGGSIRKSYPAILFAVLRGSLSRSANAPNALRLKQRISVDWEPEFRHRLDQLQAEGLGRPSAVTPATHDRYTRWP